MSKRIAILGGGRWARVLVEVLRQIAQKPGPWYGSNLIWATDRGRAAAEQLVRSHGWGNIAIVPRQTLPAGELDAAVVASAPTRHVSDCLTLLRQSVPTLCEKPIALTFADALQLLRLAEERRCPLGIDLTFAYADYLRDFAERIRKVAFEHVEIQWHDPWSENRHGEQKHPDIYTDYVSDMFPHCWTILRAIRPGAEFGPVRDVAYTPGESVVHLDAQFARAASVTVSLSRRAPARRRRVSIDRGRFLLDFSSEPGWTQEGNAKCENRWGSDRPLTKSLLDFLRVAADPPSAASWPVRLQRSIESVSLAEQGAVLLRQEQERQLDRLRRIGRQGDYSPEELALIVDALAPERAAQGERLPAYRLPEQQAFAKAVMYR